MRSSQPQGLPNTAREFLSVNAVRLNECQHCHRDDGYKREVIASYGIGGELELYRYTLKDGSTADECVQKTIWSSGPMIWLFLKCGDQEFKWESKDMDDSALGG